MHVVLSIGETNATYNEHCLPMADKRDIALCTYFKPAVPVPLSITLFGGDGSFTGFIRSLRSALQTRTYDVIHCHTPHVALLSLLVVFVCFRELMPSLIVTVHDSYSNYKLRNRLLFVPVFAGFARVVCCSRSSFNSFPPLYRSLAGKRLDFVQNGLDINRVDRIAATQKRQCDTGQFKVVAISRLVDIKNPYTMLNAFGAAVEPTDRLTYIGNGPLRQPLIEMCAAQGLDGNVAFTGLLPRDKVFEHVLAADLFISTSRGEGLPVAVLEAMACGCPVLLSDIPPHREIAGGSEFIPLVSPDDPSGFAREISRFRAMTPSNRTRIGRQCRLLVEQKFSLEAMHAGYDAIYSDISQGCSSPSHRTAGVAHAG